jgi:hypothetical protein
MPDNKPFIRPTLKSIGSYVKKHASGIEHTQGHQHEASETVREADYEGHHIVIRTTYHIEVDGKPVTGHMGVTDDGMVHYHPVPNISFASALDMVKQLIDVFPDDFSSAASKTGAQEHDASQAKSHAGHPRSTAPARSRSAARKTRTDRK